MIADFIFFALTVRPAIGTWGMNGASYAQIIPLSCYILFEVIVVVVSTRRLEKISGR